jgi:cyclophilin family peptidyl-prolyl cis-trans isomerase
MSKFEEDRGVPYTETELLTYETAGGTPHLDGQYTIFGEVLNGMQVVDQISQLATSTADRPVEDVYIINMKIIK